MTHDERTAREIVERIWPGLLNTSQNHHFIEALRELVSAIAAALAVEREQCLLPFQVLIASARVEHEHICPDTLAETVDTVRAPVASNGDSA